MISRIKNICFSFCLLFLFKVGAAQSFVSEKKEPNGFIISSANQTAIIYLDKDDDWLVNKSATLLANDIGQVTGKKAELISSLPAQKNIIIIGTLKSSIINQLASKKKLNIDDLENKWEAFRIQSVNSPFPGIENALVIVGSDKRGTAFGTLELSRQLGVSPWYWWADVPVKKKKEVYFKKGIYNYGSPSVKYRGIFINDEAPAFSGWTKEKFGGVNHLVYEKIFELLLRLKANYLWPAMWANAFNDDDTLNPILADKWGIVMGTSHHEPMLRAQQEWKRYGKGQWNYDSNEVVLKDFWRKGIEHMGSHESIVTIGMRGDGDMPMTQGTAISLLERIVADQRKIIEDVTHKPASQTPQLWALYKEVQDYYDKGMRVPDDVTLLLCDDNWGNIRRLPNLNDPKRTGGYGIYYHFDYVGGPRNYKWINTNNIARVWEQMHLAYEYGVDKIWIVNVGDLKPMEFPISFFLDYAWDVKKWNEDNLRDYYTQWAEEQFGSGYAKEIGEIIRRYSQFAARRKPELLDATTYSIENYSEASRVVFKENNLLAVKAEELSKKLPIEYKNAFYQLVLHPLKALANLNEMYFALAVNKKRSGENNLIANQFADRAKELYHNDSMMSLYYNHEMSGGKWNHMMDQTHIGYTYWQQPPVNKMPEVKYVSEQNAEEPTTKIDLPPRNAVKLIPATTAENIFYEENGYVSMQASHFSQATAKKNIKWKIIPDIGKDGDGIIIFPVTTEKQTLDENSSHLEYEFYTYSKDSLKLLIYFSPTLNLHNSPEGLQFAISIDDEQPQIISLNKEDNNVREWSKWVSDNIIIKTSMHFITEPGKHVLKYWLVDPGIVLQKLVIDFGGVRPSYLGPPETKK
jgi:hypothetical protein